MTKEELEKEAEEHCNETLCSVCENITCAFEGIKCREWRDRRAGYYCGAEPREKRIAELEDKLANADYQLEGRDNEIRELKAQIEKMKCCSNCICRGECDLSGYEECKNFDKWELRR